MKICWHALHLVLFSLFFCSTTASIAHADTPLPNWTPGETRTILVGGDDNFPPYEFTNAKGEPDGFNVELMRAVAQAMGLDMRIELGPWEAVRNQLASRRIDALSGMLYSPERDQHFDFSLPLTTVSYSLFVRKGSPIKTIEDIKNKAVVVHKDALSHDWLKAQSLTPAIHAFTQNDDALKMLSAGKYDCALIARLNGIDLLQRLEIDNIISVGPPVLVGRFCFAVARDNADLLARLNEGYHRLHTSGHYDEIYRKWFSVYTQKRYFALVLKIVLAGCALLMALSAGVFIWNRMLRGLVDRKTAALHESEVRYRELTELLPQMVFETDAAGRFTFINRHGFELSGYSPEEIDQGLEVLSLFDAADRESIGAIIAKGGNFEGREYSMVCKDGRRFPAYLFTSPILRDGVQTGHRGLLVDISDQRQLEDQIRQSQKMEALGILAGGIAHDFSNILTGVMANAELARGRLPQGDGARDCLDDALMGCRRASDLVKHIKSFSQQTGQKRAPIQVRAIVEEVLKLLRPTLADNIELQQHITAKTETILGDPTQFHQIVINLCVNASHAMIERGGILKVGLEDARMDGGGKGLGLPPGRYLYLWVSDTGSGIEASVREQIFEPHFTTKKAGLGSGMGLAIVHEIVTGSGGAVSVESEPGQGATFHVYLPVALDREESVRQGAVAPRGGEHLLIVDDDRALIDIGEKLLESAGYRVTACTSGAQAVEIFSARPEVFDLVITDHYMPEMTGVELAKKITALRKDIPIILCSAFRGAISAENLGREGIKRVVGKPFVYHNMAATIREVLDRPLS